MRIDLVDDYCFRYLNLRPKKSLILNLLQKIHIFFTMLHFERIINYHYFLFLFGVALV